jgi:hypothetical protein
VAKPSIKDVELAVCDRFNITAEQIRGVDRTRRIAGPRQIAYYLAREKTGRSFPVIGSHFGVDHSTVVHGAQKIAALIETNPKVAAYVEECRAAIPSVDDRESAKKARMQFWAQRLRDGVASWPAHLPPPVSMIPPVPMPEPADAVVSAV